MKYEARAKSLAQAVTASVRSGRVLLEKKSSTTIDAGKGANYNYTTMYVSVERGVTYRISWSAHKDAGGGADYGIQINSNDGNGSYREAFRNSGSWSFRAIATGDASFRIGVSYSWRSFTEDFPVDIDID